MEDTLDRLRAEKVRYMLPENRKRSERESWNHHSPVRGPEHTEPQRGDQEDAASCNWEPLAAFRMDPLEGEEHWEVVGGRINASAAMSTRKCLPKE